MLEAVEAWKKSLIPRISEAEGVLARLPAAELARRSGALPKERGLELEFLGKTYLLTPDLLHLDPPRKARTGGGTGHPF